MSRPSGKIVRYLAVLAAVGGLAGCSSPAPFQDLPAGGVDATTGAIVVDDIWVAGPHELAAGADAPLRLTLTNESPTTADALVGVSTPVADRVTLRRDGRPTTAITLPAGSRTDLEWRTGVELEGLRRDLASGQPFAVTLTFAKAAPATRLVIAGPLAAPPASHVVTARESTGRTR